MCIYISQYRKEIFQSPHLLTQNGLSNLTRVPPIDAHPGTKKKSLEQTVVFMKKNGKFTEIY